MTDSFQFDLNNSSNYPVLNGLDHHLYSFFQNELKRFQNKIAKEKDIIDTADGYNRYLEKVKNSLLAIRKSEYVYKLIDERDNRLANNIAGNEQRKNNIKLYNNQVVNKVISFSSFILNGILTHYPKNFDRNSIDTLNWFNHFSSYQHAFWPKNKKDKIQQNQEIFSSNVKLQWKGQKNQLYNVLRQLKEDYELIGNSYNDLAEFIKFNVIGFENTKKGTIEKELPKKESLPKPKRIKIEPDKAE